MPAVSQHPQKATGRLLLVAILIALLLAVVAGLMFSDADAGQDACIAAHAAERGVSPEQLRSEPRYQEDLVAILSSCSGMAP
ncbi:hypothetical protein [Collimonas sp.]|jgi:hypothetical protein|uniref:hypothetical protein n=1 Tax=Collimonas sp. TaxID=1963772 RepID=UPI002C4DE9E1|nr:hypothetical protein [Collimonas sp.]HWW99294.1 hypothetical protein [Collimonas sp.]